jgi:hypothetical protein
MCDKNSKKAMEFRKARLEIGKRGVLCAVRPPINRAIGLKELKSKYNLPTAM